MALFITANHILDHYSLTDGFGHISVRNPCNSSTFYMTGSPPPALVRNLDDIAEYTIGDATPIPQDGGNSSPYSERFIHAGVLARFPEAQSVVHSHSTDVVAHSDSGIPLRPLWHMSGFINPASTGAPVFEIEDYYDASSNRTLLVNNAYLGAALASEFAAANASQADAGETAHNVVLQRGHGFTTWGATIEESVYRAYYTQENARIQRHAMDLRSAQDAAGGYERVKYLNDEEGVECCAANSEYVGKAWRLWTATVGVSPLYRNELTGGA